MSRFRFRSPVGSLAAALGIFAAAALVGERGAGAYVRTTSTASGTAVYWATACIVVTPDARGSVDIPLNQVNDVLVRAASNWTTKTEMCSYLAISAAPADRIADVAQDGRPTVVFRQDVWARPNGMPHDPSAIGLTTVFYVNTPGQPGDAAILDADVELNGVNFTFTTAPETNPPLRDGTTQIADLENTLTHELGHVQGLAHNCWDHILDAPPLDDQGNPAPDCDGPLPDSILNATMYPYALMPGETSKRDLTGDDVRGICVPYPQNEKPPGCFPQVVAGCGFSEHARAAEIWIVAAGALALAALRRRRAR